MGAVGVPVMRWLILLLILWHPLGERAAAGVWMYEDENGNVHFSDQPRAGFEKKEIAKNKAVATFIAQWEKRYDRMMARKAKKRAARLKAAAKTRKRATAKPAATEKESTAAKKTGATTAKRTVKASTQSKKDNKAATPKKRGRAKKTASAK